MCVLLFVIANQLTENDQQRLANAKTRALKLRDATVEPELPKDSDPEDDFAVEDRRVDVPALEAQFREIEGKEQAVHEAEQLRLLLLAAVAAALNAVGVVLSIAGLVVPARPRGFAIIGTVLGCLLLAGLFGVLVVGSLLNPPMPAEESVRAVGGMQHWWESKSDVSVLSYQIRVV